MKTKILLLHFLVPLFALAQFTQIGDDIDGEAADDHSGQSVSLSADGSIVAIGAPVNDGNGGASGHVRVYQNTGGAWTQIGADIDGDAPGDDSGTSISLSADGNIVAIGAPLNDGQNPWSGHVRVFQNTGGSWTQIGQEIGAAGADDLCGTSVRLNGDGSIVAIGSPRNDGNGSNSGHVRVFQNTGGNWTQIGTNIEGENAGDWSGHSLGLSADGNTVAIGSKFNDGNGDESGHVRIFQYILGNWIQIGADIDGEVAGDHSGNRLSLSANGNTVAIGAINNDGNGEDSGHVRVYQNTGGNWTQIGVDIDGEAADDIACNPYLSSDGSILAIGAARNDGNGLNSGQVRIFQNAGGAWIQIGTDIYGEAADDRMGSFKGVSLNADGSIVAIGAWGNDGNGNNSGHVRVFDLGIQQTLQASFASSTTNACIQDIVEFYDQSTGGAVSWNWTFEGGSPATSTSTNPMVEYFTPGIYDVTLTVGDGVEFSTITYEDYMTVVSVPDTPETPGGDDEVCTNFTLTSEYLTANAMYAESYEWEILPAEAGTIDGAGSTGTVTWTTDWEGTASIEVKAVNEACGESEPSDAFEVECSICTGIGEYGNLAGIQVYPNPSNGQFTVKFDKNIGQTQIFVMNVLNEILYDLSTETMNGNAVSFDLSNYAEGVYFVRIKTDSSEQIRKIIVQ